MARTAPPRRIEARIIGRRVRTIRRRRGLSAAELAARCGVPLVVVRLLEDGRGPLSLIRDVADVLGVEREVFARGTHAWIGYRLKLHRT